MNSNVNVILRDCIRIIDLAVKSLDGKVPDKKILLAVLAQRFAPEKPNDAEFFLVQPEVYRAARLNFLTALDIATDIYLADRARLYSN